MAEQVPRVVDIPLSLDTNWFVNPKADDYEIPFCRANPDFALVNYGSSQIFFPSIKVTVIFACRRYSDLSRTFIKLHWDEANPIGTVVAKQQHFPPPTPLDDAQLLHCSETYGPPIVKFCQDAFRSGYKVGDGECWTLASTALESINVSPKCMGSFSLIHGQAIFIREGTACTFGSLATVRAGDIIQYLRAKFIEHDSGGTPIRHVTNGNPNHTSYNLSSSGY
jgi:hypothetical protein